MRQVDKTTGTANNPITAPFEGKRKALAAVFFYDGDTELPEGFASSVEGVVRGLLQQAGVSPSSLYFIRELDSGGDSTACLELALNVSRDVETVEETVEA